MIGKVNMATIIIVTVPILSIGIKIENINNKNVNTAKNPTKNKTIRLNEILEII